METNHKIGFERMGTNNQTYRRALDAIEKTIQRFESSKERILQQ